MFACAWPAIRPASAWLGIALGHVLYYKAVHVLGPIVCEGTLALVPFLTALLAHHILGEQMVPAQWLGGSLLVTATLLLLASRKKIGVES